MQERSDSTELAEPGEGDLAGAGEAGTVLVEVIPGVAVVLGEITAELRPGLVDFGLVSAGDRQQLTTVLSALGNAATAAGHLHGAATAAQGLYRLSSSTQTLLRSGGRLAVKDGANLGTVLLPGGGLRQARLIPVSSVTTAQRVASIGPALAMIALQMQLNEITGLVRTNLAATGQVLTAVRNEQWAELSGLVATVERAVGHAQELESVPTSLWDNVAGSEAQLRKQVELYRRNVRGHIAQIERSEARARREYLESGAEAVVFDTNALLSSVKAWTGYQALRAVRAREAGRESAEEARFVEVIVRDTRAELDSAVAETAALIGSLARELRILAELPGRDTLSQSLSGKRKDAKAARLTSARLLEAIEPLADALHPPAPELSTPELVCAPEGLELPPYLRVLRWFLEQDETVRALGFAEEEDTSGTISGILGSAKDMWSAAARTLVAVTDRRIVTAKANAFLEQGEIRRELPLDLVRYVRTAATQEKNPRLALDLITRDENLRWLFRTDVDTARVDALAAVLAESMAIPEAEREALLERARTTAPSAPGLSG